MDFDVFRWTGCFATIRKSLKRACAPLQRTQDCYKREFYRPHRLDCEIYKNWQPCVYRCIGRCHLEHEVKTWNLNTLSGVAAGRTYRSHPAQGAV